MNFISRMFGRFLLASILLVACISLSANRLFEGGSLTDWFNECAALLEAQRKGEQLAHETKLISERIWIKAGIAEALKNGEMRLIDAAACFRSLHEDPRSWNHPDRPRPGLKDGESWCREVIEWTERYNFYDQSHSQADVLRQRLEAELLEQVRRHGSVILPE